MSVTEKIRENAALIEAALVAFFAARKKTALYRAMEYSTMCGGKRIRPFLVLEVCRMLGGSDAAAIPYACALEMIHTFSLIHDDLPCMDDDDFRRGKPTNHKVFGEATALLAGDALIFSAIECAMSGTQTDAENKQRAVRELVTAAGADGMCEGQMLDIAGEGKKLAFAALLDLHAHKTGALLRAAARLGAIAAGADESAVAAVDSYGAGIGLAFQIVDDVLDQCGSAEELGKPTGSDAKNEKTTFLSHMDVAAARDYAARVTEEACAAIRGYANADTLCELATYLLQRTN